MFIKQLYHKYLTPYTKKKNKKKNFVGCPGKDTSAVNNDKKENNHQHQQVVYERYNHHNS